VHGKQLRTQCMGTIDDISAEIGRRLQADPANWMMWVLAAGCSWVKVHMHQAFHSFLWQLLAI
jgi:hypothetical protein